MISPKRKSIGAFFSGISLNLSLRPSLADLRLISLPAAMNHYETIVSAVMKNVSEHMGMLLIRRGIIRKKPEKRNWKADISWEISLDLIGIWGFWMVLVL